MSEIDTVFNKSSKQLLSLTRTLKDHTAFQDRVAESLLVKRNVEMIKKKKLKYNFRKHPDPLSSDSEISSTQPVKNGYSESTLSFNFNKSCDISTTHSEQSVLNNNFIKRSKSPERIFSPNQSCSETQITVRSRKMQVTEKENVSFKKGQQRASQSTLKLKTHAVGSKEKTVLCKTYSKVDVPSKVLEASSAKSALHKKNIDHKLRGYLQRILSCIEDIRMTMVKGIEPPDGAEDWERARVRTAEFSSRFSRNYLYQLGREMRDLQQMSRNSGSVSNRTAINIHQRMFSAHQIVLQALQAYRSHMTTLLANVLAEKLQYVVQQTYILCDIHIKFLNLDQTGSSKRESLIDVLIKRCNILLDKIQESVEKRGQINSTIFSPTTRLSLMGYNVTLKKPGKAKPRKKVPLEARLSMYSISAGMRNKDVFWKKTVEVLAKDKLRYNHVQSRYKTAGFKHRPPHEKPTVIELPTKSKLFGKRSSCLLRNTPIHTPHNEDDILTMVEMHKEKDGDASNATKCIPREQQLNSVSVKDVAKSAPRVTDCEQQSSNAKDMQLQAWTPLIQGLCQQVCAKDGEAMTQKQLEILLKGLLGMALDGKINNNNNDKETGSKKNGFVTQNEDINQQKMLENAQEIPPNLEPSENLPKNEEHQGKSDEQQGRKDEQQGKKDVQQGKIDEQHQGQNGEISENGAEAAKEIEGKVKNRKSLDKMLKNFESTTVIFEKANEGREEKNSKKNTDEGACKENKVEFEDVNISQTKRTDNGQTNKNKNKRRQTVTVTGAKNAQLICIRDEDSIIESPDEPKSIPANKNSNEQIKENSNTKDLSPSCEQNESQKNPKKNSSKLGSTNITSKHKTKDTSKASKANIKISRMPKKLLKQLVLIPKTQAFNVIQYKLQYSKFTKANHMYRKSSKVQPWVIVDTISEHLLNDLLLSVAREIQVDQILESLYHAEFQ